MAAKSLDSSKIEGADVVTVDHCLVGLPFSIICNKRVESRRHTHMHMRRGCGMVPWAAVVKTFCRLEMNSGMGVIREEGRRTGTVRFIFTPMKMETVEVGFRERRPKHR